MNHTVSVIIPVYKAEKYIRRCIDSLLCQTYTDFELLLIDDGSPDKSGIICDEYANTDSRIKVIHKANEGVSKTRQYGLEQATGEYVIHADPDDWVDFDMLEQMVKCIENSAPGYEADIVICGHYREETSGRTIIIEKPDSQTSFVDHADSYSEYYSSDIFTSLIANKIHGNVWSKLVRRSIIEKYKLYFNPELSLCEDYCFCCELCNHDALKVRFLNKAFYHYDLHSNENSIARIIKEPAIRSREKVAYILEKLIEGRSNFNVLSESIYKFKINTKLLAFYYNVLSNKSFKNLHSEVNDRYIKEHLYPSSKDLTDNCVCLGMKGYVRLGNFMWRFINEFI